MHNEMSPHPLKPVDPLNGKELMAEFGFTFAFIAPIIATNGNPIVAGVALMIAIFFGGWFGSRANHFNPAITIGLLANRQIDAVRATALIALQIAGGVLAVLAALAGRRALHLKT